MPSRDYFPPSRQSRERRRTRWIIIGVLALIALLLVVFPSALNTGGNAGKTRSTTTTAITISHVTHIYEAVLSQYDAALVSPIVAIAGATADIAKQEQRAQNDAASYSFHESGDECAGDALSPGEYQICVTGEQQSAVSALSDQNAANQAKKADVSQQVTSVQEIEAAITAFAQQLQGITWPSSPPPAVAGLEQALANYRNAYAQTATDLTNGEPVSTGAPAVAAAGSALDTQLGAMATTLGIPATTTPATG